MLIDGISHFFLDDWLSVVDFEVMFGLRLRLRLLVLPEMALTGCLNGRLPRGGAPHAFRV